MLQSAAFPRGPNPTTTIADILQLKDKQRFDLIAIIATIMDERNSPAGLTIADVRLIDGSKDPRGDVASLANATLPLTLFFPNKDSFATFKTFYSDRTPLLFTCLQGSIGENNSVLVQTLKDLSRWEQAICTKGEDLAALADELCKKTDGSADVAQLPIFQQTESTDFTSVPATLSACSLVDVTSTQQGLLGDATEHLYQLNHVYVVPPAKTDTITAGTDGRLFGVFQVWDYSKKITLGCRAKAMLQLGQCAYESQPEDAHKERHSSGELRHPLLASLRVRIKKKGNNTDVAAATEHSSASQEYALSAMIVEAEPCSLEDIPNDSVDAIHGLLAAGPVLTGERFVATTLKHLTSSPFYNMLVDGKPSEKALVFLKFQQRSNGKQISNGFRVVSDSVRDVLDPSTDLLYSTIACCTIEKACDFTVARDTCHLAIVCKVALPIMPHKHTLDLCIEAMEPVSTEQQERTIAMMQQLQRISKIDRGNPATSDQVAWQQRKCRRLQRYPTNQNAP